MIRDDQKNTHTHTHTYTHTHTHTPLYLFESSAESLEHSLHVASLLHGDDSGVVLLIHPDQEGLLIVVPEEKQLEELNKELSG